MPGQHSQLAKIIKFFEKIKFNELGRQKSERQNSWQQVKHAKLYSDRFQASVNHSDDIIQFGDSTDYLWRVEGSGVVGGIGVVVVVV